MAAGDLTCGTITNQVFITAIKSDIDALNLAAATDFLFVLPANNKSIIFKVEREA